MDAEIKIPSAGKLELSRILSVEPGACQNIDRTIKGSLCGAWSLSEYRQNYQGFSLGEPGAGQNIDRTIKGSL